MAHRSLQRRLKPDRITECCNQRGVHREIRKRSHRRHPVHRPLGQRRPGLRGFPGSMRIDAPATQPPSSTSASRPAPPWPPRISREHAYRRAGHAGERPDPAPPRSGHGLRRLQQLKASAGRPAAPARVLHRRAFHRAVRAKHATIPRLRPQHRLAALAFVEKLAGIGRHVLALGEAARRAGQHRGENRRAQSGRQVKSTLIGRPTCLWHIDIYGILK